MRDPFPRRYYRRPAQLLEDVRWLARHRAHSSGAISPAFRERLMLIVTSVNRCRSCAAFHSGVAPLAGLTGEEIALLLGGRIDAAPADEAPALVYALHWAERDARPEPAREAELVAHYGPVQAGAIHSALRVIRIGNLLGNSWDALLHTVSGGRLGHARY